VVVVVEGSDVVVVGEVTMVGPGDSIGSVTGALVVGITSSGTTTVEVVPDVAVHDTATSAVRTTTAGNRIPTT
jgi:hypothetical protein